MMKQEKLTRFWQALESVPSLCAVSAEWQHLLGAEYDQVRPFLRPQQARASSFPNPDGMPYEVRNFGGEYIGVTPDGHTITLSDDQLLIEELHRERLACALAEGLGIDRLGAEAGKGRRMHLGRFKAATQAEYACWMTFPIESDDIQTIAAHLIAEKQAPFLLFAATRRWARRQVETLLRYHGCVLVPLAEIISNATPGKFVATRSLDEIVSRATGVVSVVSGKVQDAEPQQVFRCEGTVWELTFAGKTARLGDSLGLRYLGRLIAVKHLPVDAVLLKAHAAGVPAVKPGDGFEVFDREGWERCRQEYQHLTEELDDAVANNDSGKQQHLQEQMAMLANELHSSSGLGVQQRKKQDQNASIRTSVKNAIDRTLLILKDKHPALYRHLDHSIRTGADVCYDPDPDVEWAM